MTCMLRKTVLLAWVLIITSLVTYAQQNKRLPRLVEYPEYQQIPENLLYTSTAVVISPPVSQEGGYPVVGNVQQLAGAIHPVLRNLGIDPVIYYNAYNLYAGLEVTRSQVREMRQRRIKNIILFEYNGSTYRIGLGVFNNAPELYNREKGVFKWEGTSLDDLLFQFRTTIAGRGLPRQNFLILEIPEFSRNVNMLAKRRYESFARNLKLDKLAVPAIANKEEIERVMKNYPYEYGIVDPEKSEKTLRNEGYQYILLQLNTTGKQIRNYLEYDQVEEPETYASVIPDSAGYKVKNIPADARVYKYYVKHIYSGDTYVGTHWDAAVNWEVALHYHIAHLREEMKIDASR